MEYISHSEQIPVGKSFDVIVCGGGVAGCAAAVSAARHGKEVLLLERSCILGGLGTLGLINLFVSMDNGRGQLIVKGLCQEFVELSTKYGYDSKPELWKDAPDAMDSEHVDPRKRTRYTTWYSANIFALMLAELMEKSGVTLYYDSIASEAIVSEKNGKKHIDGVIVQSKSGRTFHPAKEVVDTTGDADVLYRAGVPCRDGRNFYTYTGYETNLRNCQKAIDQHNIHLVYQHCAGGNATLYGDRQMEGKKLYKGTTVEEVSEYILSNQMIMLQDYKGGDRWERDIAILPGMPQFRTTRCIEGGHTFTSQDAFKHFDDSISLINDFDRNDLVYEVPYRCLVNEGFDNIITAGRSASAQGYGWDVLRVIPPAIVTGQAAGDACAQAIDEGSDINRIDIGKLQKTLESENVLIHYDESMVPNDFSDIGKYNPSEDVRHA